VDQKPEISKVIQPQNFENISKKDAAEMRLLQNIKTIIYFLFMIILSLVALLLTSQNFFYGSVVFIIMWVIVGYWINVFFSDIIYLNKKYELGYGDNIQTIIFKNMFNKKK
jgi:hypothetical protein